MGQIVVSFGGNSHTAQAATGGYGCDNGCDAWEDVAVLMPINVLQRCIHTYMYVCMYMYVFVCECMTTEVDGCHTPRHTQTREHIVTQSKA